MRMLVVHLVCTYISHVICMSSRSVQCLSVDATPQDSIENKYFSQKYSRKWILWLSPFDKNRILWLFWPCPEVVTISGFYCIFNMKFQASSGTWSGIAWSWFSMSSWPQHSPRPSTSCPRTRSWSKFHMGCSTRMPALRNPRSCHMTWFLCIGPFVRSHLQLVMVDLS